MLQLPQFGLQPGRKAGHKARTAPPAAGTGSQTVRINKPDDAQLALWRDKALLTLRSDWLVAGKTWPRGALLVADAADFLRGRARYTALFTPTPARSLEGYTISHDTVILN